MKANIHIYQKIFKDLSYSLSLRNFYSVITARTGWSPEGSSDDSFDPNSFEKHDPHINPLTKFYAFMQFLCMSYAAVVLFADKNMEYDQGVMLISIVIFSMFCTAKWLDAEKIIKLEYFKLAMIFICLCYLYSFSPGIFLINVLLFYFLLNIAFLPFLDRE